MHKNKAYLGHDFGVQSGQVALEGAMLVKGLVAVRTLDAELVTVLSLHVLESCHPVLESLGAMLATDVPASVHVFCPVDLPDMAHDSSVRWGHVGAVGAPVNTCFQYLTSIKT